jgi:Ser/Thr protein kinase RdoA (MazF antagonist)
MMPVIATPYNGLTPDVILNAIDSVGYLCSSNLSALNSYENRVYQVGMEDSAPLIAKFYRPNRWSDAAILEEHQFALELSAHEIPVVAPLVTATGATLHEYEGFRFALFPRKGGRALELDNLEQLEWMGRFLGRLHAVGAQQPFQHRLRIDPMSYGYHPYQTLIEYGVIPPDIKTDYCAVMDALLARVAEIFQRADGVNFIRLHGDCHAGNVLWNDTGPHIVDLDDCLMGPAVQDIWMLISEEHEYHANVQLQRILQGYRMFHDFNTQELGLIEALRSLRLIHYSAWLAKRWQDPTFPLNFPWFNTPRYWQEQLRDLHKQLLLLEQGNESAISLF